MPVIISQRGSFTKTLRFLKKIRSKKFYNKLEAYGRMGVEALSAATPKRTGKTAESCVYEIKITDKTVSIIWTNSNIVDDWANVAVLIQYGHATRNGGYVQGIDYINPAMKPIFDKIADEVWVEVTTDE